MRNKIHPQKEKLVGTFGSISASLGFAHNVCHSLCVGVVAILSVFGIAIVGMPLVFLDEYKLYFWGMGAIFLALALLLYFRKRGCISRKLILANSGIVIAGTPFDFLQNYSLFLWIFGGVIVGISILLYLKEKREFTRLKIPLASEDNLARDDKNN